MENKLKHYIVVKTIFGVAKFIVTEEVFDLLRPVGESITIEGTIVGKGIVGEEGDEKQD